MRSLTDNVTVFPTPSRSDAYYDNLTSPHDPLDDTYLDNNLRVRARGYFENPEAFDLILQSYWISIGGTFSPDRNGGRAGVSHGPAGEIGSKGLRQSP